MPRTREEIEQLERQFLAPYAQFSADTRGREHAEEPPDWRTHYQRDRDRVIHSRAFRRLEYKTQVFLNGSGDHLRTRLTHTMEVAAIARNIARALKLNDDLAEMGEAKLATYFIKNAAKMSDRFIVHYDQHQKHEVETPAWLPAGKITVGITAGASCPNNLIEETIRRLFELRGISVQELLKN